ncbi:MAG: helix-hairpin-helix domain-containing protein [Parasporobacterium sp.]|nr:helix-hairpin-helix domain-containing protein [Parasporobacterium sp.]
MKNKKLIKVLAAVLALVIAGVIYTLTAGNSSVQVSAAENAAEGSTEAETIPEDSTEPSALPSVPDICVHVCGSVVNPGVYYLYEGDRVNDAVIMAGGLREDASSESVNLAEAVKDGIQIYIPSREEAAAGNFGPAAQADDGLININTATPEVLTSLPGIGETKAEAIIKYRDSFGPFSSIEEIMNVAGIKESSFEKIKEYIKV